MYVKEYNNVFVMKTVEDVREYPVNVSCRHFESYVKKACPSIILFEKKSDPRSWKITESVTKKCKLFPKVFCYIINWENFLKNYLDKYYCEIYEVSVWRSNDKLLFYTEPNSLELDIMFSYCNTQILGEDKECYMNIITDHMHVFRKYAKRKKEIEKNKLKNTASSISSIQNQVSSMILSNNDTQLNNAMEQNSRPITRKGSFTTPNCARNKFVSNTNFLMNRKTSLDEYKALRKNKTMIYEKYTFLNKLNILNVKNSNYSTNADSKTDNGIINRMNYINHLPNSTKNSLPNKKNIKTCTENKKMSLPCNKQNSIQDQLQFITSCTPFTQHMNENTFQANELNSCISKNGFKRRKIHSDNEISSIQESFQYLSCPFYNYEEKYSDNLY